MTPVSPDILKALYPSRGTEGRKYDSGLVMVIGGSAFYSGAPALSALAAFRAGADMVHVVAPKRAADIIASFSPIVAAYPIDAHYITEEHVPALLAWAKADQDVARGNFALVLGGGMGRSPEVRKAIRMVLAESGSPAVIDADGIYAVAEDIEVIRGKPVLLTPHRYEFFVLTGKDVEGLDTEGRAQAVQEEAERLGVTILLKGGVDIISDGERVLTSETGTPYMTVGGTGDTLAGVAGTLLARRGNPVDAGAAAAYLNGKAGEIAARELKESLVATDVIDAIPRAIP